MTVPAQGASSQRPDPKDGALYHVIPANDTKGSKFGPTNFPRRRRGSNPGPLAQETLCMMKLPSLSFFLYILQHPLAEIMFRFIIDFFLSSDSESINF